MPETVTAAGHEAAESGTQAAPEASFDPSAEQVLPAVESERAASGEEAGDGGASGKTATPDATGKPAAAATDTPGQEPDKAKPAVEGNEVDEVEEQLKRFEEAAATGTEGKKPEVKEDGELTPEQLRAEIEASAQKPEERLENTLKIIGKFATEKGALKKERDQYKQAFETVAGLYEFDQQGGIKGLNRENLTKVLDRFGLEVLPKGQARTAVTGKAGTKYDADLVDKIAGNLGIEADTLQGMAAEDKLELIGQNAEAVWELRDQQKARNEHSQRETEQRQQQFRQEMELAATELAKRVPNFKERVPVIEQIWQELQQDQSGKKVVQTLHELYEYRQLRQGGLRKLVTDAKASERGKVLKALTVLGLNPADMEAALAGKPPMRAPARRGAAKADTDWIGSPAAV